MSLTACPICPIFSTFAEAMWVNFDYLVRTHQSCHEEGVTLNLVLGSWALRVHSFAFFPYDSMWVPSSLVYSPSTIQNETLLWTSGWFGPSPHLPFISEKLNPIVNAQSCWLVHCLILSFNFTPGPRHYLSTDRYCNFPDSHHFPLPSRMYFVYCQLEWNPSSLSLLRHLIWIMGNSAWVQLQSHFTFHKFRITPVLNTCFFLPAYCSDRLWHFIWHHEDHEIITTSWTVLA